MHVRTKPTGVRNRNKHARNKLTVQVKITRQHAQTKPLCPRKLARAKLTYAHTQGKPIRTISPIFFGSPGIPPGGGGLPRTLSGLVPARAPGLDS